MAKNREPEKPVSGSFDETASEEESDSEPELTQVNSNGARKPRSKPLTPAKSKHPEEEKESEAKDSKKKLKPENSDSKKLLFQRIWSEDDEIVILKGMIDYASKTKSDPIADLNAFHDFIKKNLHVDVTRTQLQAKIRRLKKKHENNKGKGKEGKDRTFTRPHEQKAYELSKKIWGNENGVEKVVEIPKANGSSSARKRADIEEAKDDSIKRLNFNGVSVEERILSIGTQLFEDGKKEFTEWKKLRMEEMELYQKHVEVKSAQMKLVIDALKHTDH